ncbi:MAG: 4Fe-4S dicluster domain-containing protein [Rhodobacterales bacterium]|nr:4Fe-4S dicluster domain-containing protein [Rhodobacterales bacterium]
MTGEAGAFGAPRVLAAKALDQLITLLAQDGYEVIGPTERDGAVVYDTVDGAADLPLGRLDEQEGGSYRLKSSRKAGYFHHVVGPHNWKRFLYPPHQVLFTAARRRGGFSITVPDAAPPKRAFVGVRACDLAAIQKQDTVFTGRDYKDPGYAARRAAALVVAVNCTRAGGTCFCASMGTGPQVGPGYDLVLTERLTGDRHEFLAQAGSQAGADLLDKLKGRAAKDDDVKAAEAAVTKASRSMGRTMVDGVETLLKENLEHPRWDEVARRCLYCANCTMVCPTCFCSNTQDETSLDGNEAQRVRTWNSCFSIEFSYIHGGAIRREGRSRYRQWITHKLAHWHDQFGSSGCTGCGRCITWCPVGIDITEEARAIAADKGRTKT